MPPLHQHPCYPGTGTLILLGDWATGVTDDDDAEQRTGMVVTIGFDADAEPVVSVQDEHDQDWDLQHAGLQQIDDPGF